MKLLIEVFPSGPIGTNTYIVYDPISLEAVMIDAGARNDKMTEFIVSKKLKIKMIITTHAHFDHVFGSGYYKNLL